MMNHKAGCEPYVYCDCPSVEEMLAEARAELEALRKGDFTAMPPWFTPHESIVYVEQEVDRLQEMAA